MKSQTVDYPLAVGLDSRSDEQTLQPTKLKDLYNWTLDTLGRLRKRYGYAELPTTPQNGDRATGNCLHAYKDQLVHSGAGQVVTYLEGFGVWGNRGPHVGWQTRERSLGTILPEFV